MTNRKIPSANEIADAERKMAEFQRRREAVPDEEKVWLTSGKFAGPVGEPEEADDE